MNSTQKLLRKYRYIIAGLLQLEPEQIKFYISNRGNTPEDKKIEDEIGELVYQKSSDFGLGTYTVKYNNGNTLLHIASFMLYELPHCCAFMVSCKASVHTLYRKKGLGRALNNLRQEIGILLGYSSILCTDIEKNEHQRRILKGNGWKDVFSVINKRTKNKVFLTVKQLK